MSLIHEALKKAEEQRRLGQPPDLGSPFSRPPQRRSFLPFLAIAIVIAAGAGWWLTRPPASAPAASAKAKTEAPAVASKPAAAAGSATGATAQNPSTQSGDPPLERVAARSSAAERAPAPPAPPLPVTAPPPIPGSVAMSPGQGKRPPGLGKALPDRESAPVPAGAAPANTDKATASANLEDGPNRALAEAMRTRMKAKKDAAGNTAVAAQGDLKTSPATKPDKIPMPDTGPTTRKPDATTAVATTAVATDPLPPGTKKPEPAPGQPKPEPAGVPHDAANASAIAAGSTLKADEPPMSWQLPYNVRKDLPAINVTMHVFSADPAKRFVVINGDRKAEGDTLGTDVSLREIRVDGIVLEFHGQKFLVPRGGT